MIKNIHIFIIISVILLYMYIYYINKTRERFTNKNKPIVFKLNNNGGFFSLFFFVCQAYIYAKKYNHSFYIKTEDGWIYTYKNGWKDYFTVIDEFNENDAIFISHETMQYNTDLTENKHFTVQDYVNAIQEIIKFVPNIQEKIEQEQAKLGDNYIAIYIRRGDKITSGESNGIDIRKLVNEFGINNKETTIFVQTDDYGVIDELKQFVSPKSKIVTLTPKNKFGSTQANNYKMNKLDVYNDTIELLVSCILCANATEAYIDTRSNVGRFIKLYALYLR